MLALAHIDGDPEQPNADTFQRGRNFQKIPEAIVFNDFLDVRFKVGEIELKCLGKPDAQLDSLLLLPAAGRPLATTSCLRSRLP